MIRYIFDKNMEQFYPQEIEPKVVCACCHCGTILYEGDEVIADDNGNYFCNMDCFIEDLKEENKHSYTTLESE